MGSAGAGVRERREGTLARGGCLLRWTRFALGLVLALAGIRSHAADDVPWTVSDQAAAASPAEPAATDAVREALARSYEHENAKRYSQAIESLKPVVDQPGQEYLVNLRLGWLHYLNGDYENADRYYRKAVEAAPQSTEPRVGYLLPLLAQQRYAEAEKVARRVIELDPANYYANLRLAHALRRQGRLAEAEQVAKKMLQLQPTDVSLLSELALVHVAQGRKGEARAAFEQILTLSPTNSLARQQLGLPETPPELPEETPPAESSVGVELSAVDECRPTVTALAPYYAYLDYGHESIKDCGSIWGIYGSLSAVNSLEADYEYTDILFRDGWRLEQHDWTAVASYLEVPNWKLRLGGHTIANNDPLSNGAWVVIAGAHFYQAARWDVGADAYFTRYDGQPTNKSITQFVPHLGLQQPVDDDCSLRMDVRGCYINTDSEIWDTGREDFYSLEARVGLDRDWLGLAFFGWTGEQAFAVRQDGFVVFNLNELHTGGYGGELRCLVAPRSQLTVRIADEYYSQFLIGVPTHRLLAMGMWTWTF